MNKKTSLILTSIALLVMIQLTPVAAVPKDENKVPNGSKGNSNVAHLYLFEKDPETWEIVDGGAWAKMKYVTAGDELKVVFNGHGLHPLIDYALIYYPDPWPGTGMISLGNATANKGGNIHMVSSVDTGDLPIEDDDNYPPGQDEESDTGDEGAKIWLTLFEDVDFETKRMSGWNPNQYLFEYDLIFFDDTTPIPV